MRVLHLTDDLAGMSGVRSYLLQLADTLASRGVECELFTPRRSGGPLRDHLTRWAGRGYARELAERLAGDPPDLVHAHNLWMRLSPLPLRAAKEAGLPVVMTVHDYQLVCPRTWMIRPDDRPCPTGFGPACLGLDCRGSREGLPWLPYNQLRWLKVALHRAMLRRWVDLFLAPSQHLGSWLRRSLGVPEVAHLPNFARAPEGPPVGAGDPERLLFAGRLSREKGVDVLLRALAVVATHRPGARLVVAGDGPERSALGDLAAGLGLADRVELTGQLFPDELEARYREAGLCVLPTLWTENCPVALLEAMAHGRPVIATRIGGLPELVADGETGLLFERGDVNDLAETIAHAIGRPDRLADMGRRAHEVFLERYSPPSHADRLLAHYRTLLRPGGC